MGVQIQTVLFVALLMVLCDLTTAQQKFCAKVDFNRTSFTEFGACHEKHFEILYIKDYASNKDLKPNRPTARYFLSNRYSAYSCVETNLKLSLNQNSTYETAVFLKSDGKSFLEIVVYDGDRHEPIDSFWTGGSNGWQIIKRNLKKVTLNARVRASF